MSERPEFKGVPKHRTVPYIDELKLGLDYSNVEDNIKSIKYNLFRHIEEWCLNQMEGEATSKFYKNFSHKEKLRVMKVYEDLISLVKEWAEA